MVWNALKIFTHSKPEGRVKAEEPKRKNMPGLACLFVLTGSSRLVSLGKITKINASNACNSMLGSSSVPGLVIVLIRMKHQTKGRFLPEARTYNPKCLLFGGLRKSCLRFPVTSPQLGPGALLGLWHWLDRPGSVIKPLFSWSVGLLVFFCSLPSLPFPLFDMAKSDAVGCVLQQALAKNLKEIPSSSRNSPCLSFTLYTLKPLSPPSPQRELSHGPLRPPTDWAGSSSPYFSANRPQMATAAWTVQGLSGTYNDGVPVCIKLPPL